MNPDSPIPGRIFNFAEIIEDRGDTAVKVSLKCTCGCKNFNVHYLGKKGTPFLSSSIVKIKHDDDKRIVFTAKCNTCKNQILVYDSFIDGRENHKNTKNNFTGEYCDFNCDKCNQNNLNIYIAYNSCGKEELIKQNIFNWKDCFEEVFISGVCAGCNKAYNALLEG